MQILFFILYFRPFGGLIRDMKMRYSWYLSDITDGFNLQCLASILFLYFACVTPIVTFGGLLGQATDGYMVRTFIMSCIIDCNLFTNSQVPPE